MAIWSKFRDGNRGNVAFVFAVSIVPLLFAVGAALDLIRANQAEAALQGAADAAALAAGASDRTTDADTVAIATNYVRKNFTARVIEDIKAMTITNNAAAGELTVQLTGEVQTTFFGLVGFPTFNVRVSSTASRASTGPLELVLALDITGSMSVNGKIDSLKTASTSLIDTVMNSDDISVGIVPFSDYMNVGLSRADEFWVSVPDDVTRTGTSCDYNYPDKRNCAMVTLTCYSDGVPHSCVEEQCEYWGIPEKTNCVVNSAVDTWDGCVGAREESLQASIGSITTPYPGVLDSCGKEFLPLTSDRSTVLTNINQLSTYGETNIPSGLIWGWNMLTPEEPLSEARSAADMSSLGGTKVLVLMTDGANTVSPNGTDHSVYAPHAETSYGDGTYTDTLTSTICENIKADGIQVYTVLFDVSDPGIESILRNCATSPDMSYVAADSAALIAAFEAIGAQLKDVRLTQ